jgi:hypothetical protein
MRLVLDLKPHVGEQLGGLAGFARGFTNFGENRPPDRACPTIKRRPLARI